MSPKRWSIAWVMALTVGCTPILDLAVQMATRAMAAVDPATARTAAGEMDRMVRTAAIAWNRT